MPIKAMTSAEVRQSFLDFFAARGHTIVPSASLVPADDPTLLFTNAGMNQFKDVFLGIGTRPYKRAADAQRCLRVSGKHNDLDDVGRDDYHHTLFEMLGNWSFGDYYKQETIGWAWELLTEVWGLPKERLWATVFRDEEGVLETDEEAAGFWRSETDIDPAHILYFGRKDNFWEMADTGPCGPNSEIHYDYGPEACNRQGEPGHVCRVNGDCTRFVELWNLVFIQYNRTSSGTLEPLPAKHVDTGAGFERLVALLQGVRSNYDTDLFRPIMQRVREIAGQSEAEAERDRVAYRVIADHGRAITFLIGDGVLPGNEGRNYVLRMILRRAVRFGRTLGLTEPFLARVAEAVIQTMAGHYPELEARRPFILTTITQEEQRFLRTLDLGLERLDEALAEVQAQGAKVVPGVAAFRLYDTFGLPLEITRDVAHERGLEVDEVGYREALDEQRRRARTGEGTEVADSEALASYRALLEDLQRRGSLRRSRPSRCRRRRTGAGRRARSLQRHGVRGQRARPAARWPTGPVGPYRRPRRGRARQDVLLCGIGWPGLRYGGDRRLSPRSGRASLGNRGRGHAAAVAGADRPPRRRQERTSRRRRFGLGDGGLRAAHGHRPQPHGHASAP